MIKAAEQAVPVVSLEARACQQIHEELARQAPPIGTMPPPATIKGAVKAAIKGVEGEKSSVLLDKLGERLAFERGGVRLYEALLVKHAAAADPRHGVTTEAIEEIRDDELRHL